MWGKFELKRGIRFQKRDGILEGQSSWLHLGSFIKWLYRCQLHHQEEGLEESRCSFWSPSRFYFFFFQFQESLHRYFMRPREIDVCYYAGVGGYAYLLEPLWWVGMLTSKHFFFWIVFISQFILMVISY